MSGSGSGSSLARILEEVRVLQVSAWAVPMAVAEPQTDGEAWGHQGASSDPQILASQALAAAGAADRRLVMVVGMSGRQGCSRPQSLASALEGAASSLGQHWEGAQS